MQTKHSDQRLVSVVIPAFNAADTIAMTIDSLRKQTYPSIEIIVVNDGSTDGTEDVLADFEPEVHVISLTNQGIAVARGAGMLKARGAYIAWLDSDDICDPNSIAYRVAILEARPDVALVSTAFESFDASSSRPDVTLETYYSNINRRAHGVADLYPEEAKAIVEGTTVPYRVGNLYLPLFEGNVIHPPTVMFRREAFEQHGFPDPGYFVPDPDYFIRIARFGLCAVIPLPLLRYRLSPDQVSSARNRNRLQADSLRCIDAMINADPALRKTHPEMIRRRFGHVYASSVAVFADDNKWWAFRCLVKALRYGRAPDFSSIVRLFLPTSGISLIRKLKARKREVRSA
ncbi:MAG: glycosyltransferase family A protein [Pseudomonadota bacterium]